MSDSESQLEREKSDYERLGGEAAVRELVWDFIDRVTSDLMIGFFFRKVPIERLKKMELSFAIAHLGGPRAYGGRAIDQAHAPHRIMGGQFNRRLRILEQTLDDHGVPRDITERWLSHNESLRHHVTVDGPFACNGELPSATDRERRS